MRGCIINERFIPSPRPRESLRTAHLGIYGHTGRVLEQAKRAAVFFVNANNNSVARRQYGQTGAGSVSN